MEQTLSELKAELKEQEEAALAMTEEMADEMGMLKEKVKLLESENEKLLKDKENLLDEVS